MKKCKYCEHFRIDYEPYRYIGAHTEPGQASCSKHNLVVNFVTKKKIETLSCVEKEVTE
jgi:hypothetical protein